MQNVVKGNISVWIWPTKDHELKEGETLETSPFKARLSTDRVWETDAVKVHTTEVGVVVPAGLDLRQKMIDTLEEDRTRIMAEAQEKLERIGKKLAELRQLTYDRNTVLSGELVVDEDSHPVPAGY